jgi:hypothetical protein
MIVAMNGYNPIACLYSSEAIISKRRKKIIIIILTHAWFELIE